MELFVLTNDGGVLKTAGGLLQINDPGFGGQLIRTNVKMHIAADLQAATGEVVGDPVGANSGHGQEAQCRNERTSPGS